MCTLHQEELPFFHLLDDESEFVFPFFLESVFVEIDFGVERVKSVRRQNPVFRDVGVGFNPDCARCASVIGVIITTGSANRRRAGTSAAATSNDAGSYSLSGVALESDRSSDRNGALLMIETRSRGNSGDEKEEEEE